MDSNVQPAATSLTRALAEFTASTPCLPAAAVLVAVSGITDSVATMLAGQHEPVVDVVRSFVRQRQPQACDASLLLSRERAPASDAALVNGTAAHALDYDDVALGGHPSTVLMPALLAEGERIDASGAAVLRAYVVGYEVWAELAARDPDPYHEKGWHPTAVLGTVAAAAAAAHLNGLPVTTCANAIAIAASMASGLVANFGTMAKPLHAGRAAACGLDAVRLAELGLTAAPDAIEHHAGYLAALSPQGRSDAAVSARALGQELRILDAGVSIKKYPACYATHRAIDGILALAAANDVDADDVAEVRVTIGATQASMLRNHAPRTALEAKFSLEFAAAAALVARSVGLRELTDEFVARPAVRRAMDKVTTRVTDTRCPIEPVFAFADRVEIELANGTTLDTGDIRFARGNAKAPLLPGELRAKFLDCASRDRGRDAAKLFEQLQDLAALASVRGLAGGP